MKPVLQTSLLGLLLGATLLGGCANDVANVKTFVTGSIERENWVSASALMERRVAARRARGETLEDEPALAYNTDPAPGGYAPVSTYSETASTESAPLPPIVLADEVAPMPDPVDGAPLPPIAVAEAEAEPQQTPAPRAPTPPAAARKVQKKTPPVSTAANPATPPSPMVMPVAAVSPADEKPSIRDECLQRVANYYGKDGAAKKAKDAKEGKEKFEMDTLCALVLKRTAEPGDDTPGWVTPPQAADRPVVKEADAPAKPDDDTKAAGEEAEPLSIRDQCLQRLVNVYGRDDRDSPVDANEKIEMDALCAKVLKRTSDSKSSGTGSLGPGWKSLRDASAVKPTLMPQPMNSAPKLAAAR